MTGRQNTFPKVSSNKPPSDPLPRKVAQSITNTKPEAPNLASFRAAVTAAIAGSRKPVVQDGKPHTMPKNSSAVPGHTSRPILSVQPVQARKYLNDTSLAAWVTGTGPVANPLY